MTEAPYTRVDHVTEHEIHHHDSGETFTVQVIHFADGDHVTYRLVPHPDDPAELVPWPADGEVAEVAATIAGIVAILEE